MVFESGFNLVNLPYFWFEYWTIELISKIVFRSKNVFDTIIFRTPLRVICISSLLNRFKSGRAIWFLHSHHITNAASDPFRNEFVGQQFKVHSFIKRSTFNRSNAYCIQKYANVFFVACIFWQLKDVHQFCINLQFCFAVVVFF